MLLEAAYLRSSTASFDITRPSSKHPEREARAQRGPKSKGAGCASLPHSLLRLRSALRASFPLRMPWVEGACRASPGSLPAQAAGQGARGPSAARPCGPRCRSECRGVRAPAELPQAACLPRPQAREREDRAQRGLKSQGASKKTAERTFRPHISVPGPPFNSFACAVVSRVDGPPRARERSTPAPWRETNLSAGVPIERPRHGWRKTETRLARPVDVRRCSSVEEGQDGVPRDVG
jgi:hypothetical protein